MALRESLTVVHRRLVSRVHLGSLFGWSQTPTVRRTFKDQFNCFVLASTVCVFPRVPNFEMLSRTDQGKTFSGGQFHSGRVFQVKCWLRPPALEAPCPPLSGSSSCSVIFSVTSSAPHCCDASRLFGWPPREELHLHHQTVLPSGGTTSRSQAPRASSSSRPQCQQLRLPFIFDSQVPVTSKCRQRIHT